VHPACDGDRPFVRSDLDRRLENFVLSDARRVNESFLGEIHPVVDQELMVAFHAVVLPSKTQSRPEHQCRSGIFVSSASAGSPIHTQMKRRLSAAGKVRILVSL
jgi:hypothetical protein